MNFSQPLVTPEELQCLLGWPLSAGLSQGTGSQAQTPPAGSTPQVTGLTLSA